MNLPNYPSPEVKEFGERVANALYNADIRKAMNGIGGCNTYDLIDFDEDTHLYIEAYLRGNRDSVAIMYAAMRDKELERKVPDELT